MSTRFEKARFHIDFGPKSLFDRVSYKMKNVVKLNIDSIHYNERVAERKIPKEVMDRIAIFSVSDWRLVVCEVRIDKGKFVNSTWEIVVDGKKYWITIGFNNTVETIVQKNSSGTDGITKTGELYDYVDKVNSELMSEETDNV